MVFSTGMIDFFKCGDASKLSHLATICFMKLSISIIHGDHKSKKWNVVNVVRIYFKTYWLYLEKKYYYYSPEELFWY